MSISDVKQAMVLAGDSAGWRAEASKNLVRAAA